MNSLTYANVYRWTTDSLANKAKIPRERMTRIEADDLPTKEEAFRICEQLGVNDPGHFWPKLAREYW